MKKFKSLLIALSIVICGLLTACSTGGLRSGNNTYLSGDQFKQKLSGYSFSEETSLYAKDNPKMEEVILASNSSGSIMIEYWRFQSDKNASQAFHRKDRYLKTQCGDDNCNLDKSKDLSVATAKKDGRFYILALKGNTYLYSVVETSNQNTIIRTYKSLGFYQDK